MTDWKGKKILVNGVSGFMGSNLAREMLKKGAIIYSIDNFSYIDLDIAKKKLDFLNKVNLINGDVSKEETWNIVPKDIEYIFHFAGPSSITLFKRYPKKCYHETVFGLYNVLEFAKKNGVKKVVYPSTGSLYAGSEMPHREDLYPKGFNIYAAAKVACEALANSYSNDVKSVGLRIFAGYGPGEEWKRDFGSIIYLFIRDIMENKKPVIYGDGNQTRDFVHIEDVIKAIIRAAEIEHGGIINVGTGESVSFNEILRIVNKLLNTNAEAEYIKKETNYVEDLEADTFRMRKILGIKPMNPEEGIRKFVEYLLEENKKVNPQFVKI